MLVIRRFPENIAGRTKGRRGPHAARVFETPGIRQPVTKELDNIQVLHVCKFTDLLRESVS